MKTILKIASLATLISTAPASIAGEFFIGLNAGTSNFTGLQDECDDLLEDNRLVGGLPVSCVITDDSDTTLSINAGYNFNRVFGLEVGYVDLGEYGADFSASRITASATASADFTYAGLVLSAPFTDNFSISARLGGVNANAEASSDSLGVGVELEDETLAFVGASMDYRVAERISLQLRYDYLSEVDITSAGIRFHF